jgi:hypothetical protein
MTPKSLGIHTACRLLARWRPWSSNAALASLSIDKPSKWITSESAIDKRVGSLRLTVR